MTSEQKSRGLRLPRLIGICGHPKSGKSLVQEMLQRDYGVTPVDDGEALREIAMRHFGATRPQVYTQEGKASLAYWPNGEPITDTLRGGMHMQWRQVLGRVGHVLEELIGQEVMPKMACAKLPANGHFSFGSVRKVQGAYYRRNGGIIIEVRNPLAEPSGNDFDVYDASLVTHVIENDALARGLDLDAARADLRDKVKAFVRSLAADWVKAA